MIPLSLSGNRLPEDGEWRRAAFSPNLIPFRESVTGLMHGSVTTAVLSEDVWSSFKKLHEASHIYFDISLLNGDLHPQIHVLDTTRIQRDLEMLDLRASLLESDLEERVAFELGIPILSAPLVSDPIWVDVPPLFEDLPSFSILKSSAKLAQLLKGIGRLRFRLISALVACASLSSRVKTVFLAEERFFEYHGTGRPPDSTQVLRMGLVPVS